MTRVSATEFYKESKIRVKATFGATAIDVYNVISLIIIPREAGTLPSTCESTTWKCQHDCNDNDLVINANVTSATQTYIKANTYGCAGCKPDYYLEYAKVDGFFVRKCVAEATRRMLADNNTNETHSRRMLVAKAENVPCGLGLLYDKELLCTKPCSEAINGCALCSSAETCLLCDSAAKSLLSVYDNATTKTVSVCRAITEVCADCQTCSLANCDMCSSGDPSRCAVCK